MLTCGSWRWSNRSAVRTLSGRDYARIALAGVRIFNGGASLLAPGTFARRLGTEADAHGPAVHIARMFGIRTILIGLDLLSTDPAVRRHALRLALLVHCSDTVSAAAAGLSKQLPPRPAALATGVSAVNVVLAALASEKLR
jgi:hypothetical protein